jgi:cytochrome c-type biogenesis protein CcmH
MIKRCIVAAVLAFAIGVAADIFVIAPLRAQQQADRVKEIGGKFMCMCTCSQVLTQCNHVGCTTSDAMLKELKQWVARGDSETAITQAFVQEFGTKVYAEPPRSGLSLVAWSLPAIYLAVGTALVILIVLRWRARPTPRMATPGVPSGITQDELDQARRRVARETED